MISKGHCHHHDLCVTKVRNIALFVPCSTTFYWTRWYVDREKSHVVYDCSTARPLACISLRQLRGTYRIVRISNHLFNIASPAIDDLVVKRSAFSTLRRARMHFTCGRRCASPSPFLKILVLSYEYIFFHARNCASLETRLFVF